MGKVLIDPWRPVYPTPAGLITSLAPDGTPNIITLGEVFNLSLHSPPIAGIAIRKATYSHGLITASREFVINLPTTRIVEQVERCGSVSGRDADKFALTGLTPIPASRVKPPLIAECPINIECVLLKVEEIGDHDLFQGEVVAVHADDDVLGDDGKVAYDRLDAMVLMLNYRVPRVYYALGEKKG